MPVFVTDWKFPGTMVGNRITAAGGNDFDWINENNCKADDGSSASSTTTGADTDATGLAATNFDFSEIPSDALIIGIEVRIGDYALDVNVEDDSLLDYVRLILQNDADGNQVKTNTSKPTTSLQTHDHGGAGDNWTQNPTPADVQDADWGFLISWENQASAEIHTLSVDFMQMRIHYQTGLPALVSTTNLARGYQPPYRASNGHYYAVFAAGTTIEAFKAKDPNIEASWAIQDGTNNPVHSGQYTHGHTVQVGDVIHIATIDSVIGDADDRSYHQFNMATDLWVVTDELIERPANAAYANRDISIAVRDDGDPVVFYKGDIHRNMGDDKDGVDVNVRESGTWGGPIGVDAGGDVHYGNSMIIKSLITDEMHLFFQRTTVTDDPPLTRQDIQARTFRADDSLSTVDTDTQDTAGHLQGYRNPLVWDDAGNQIMLTAGIHGASGGARHYMPCTVDGSDDVVLGTAVADTAGADGRVNAPSDADWSAIVRDQFGIIHQVYSGGGTDGVDADLYYTKSDDDGATWDTPIEIRDGVAVNHLAANIYHRDCSIVLGMLYSNAFISGTHYDELILYDWECKPVQQLSYRTKLR